MDTMRNLRGSLPRSNSRQRQAAPPADLLQTFKQAALNVTNLYRQATEDMTIARRAGYQDAIYELLALMDKENIGLGDGEGWRIRRWATEKQQLGPERESGSEEPEIETTEAEEREVSPIQEEEQPVQPESSPVRELQPSRTRPSTPPPMSQTPQSVPSGDFTFQADVAYPEAQMQTPQVSADPVSISRVTATRQGASHRGTRRSGHVNQRHGSRPTRLGAGAGSKRKEQFGDLFGLGNLDFRDPFGGHGPKRPRPT